MIRRFTKLNGKLKIEKGHGSVLDFQIENSGENLSHGEKQIINFLRIFIGKEELICLDEATSNIDWKTGFLPIFYVKKYHHLYSYA